MAKKNPIIHRKELGGDFIRDLKVEYRAAFISYSNYKRSPTGIYFSFRVMKRTGSGALEWTMGQATDGYLCAVELDRYRPSVLKAVQKRVRENADFVHTLIENKRVAELMSLLAGDVTAKDLKAKIEGEANEAA